MRNIKNQSGQSIAEYTLILLVVLLTVLGFGFLGQVRNAGSISFGKAVAAMAVSIF